MKYFKLLPFEIRALPDEDYIEMAASALWLDEREQETIRIGVNHAIAAAFGEKK